MSTEMFVVIGNGIAWGLGDTPEAAVADAAAACGPDRFDADAVTEAYADGTDEMFVARATPRLVAAIEAKGGQVSMEWACGWRPLADLADADD